MKPIQVNCIHASALDRETYLVVCSVGVLGGSVPLAWCAGQCDRIDKKRIPLEPSNPITLLNLPRRDTIRVAASPAVAVPREQWRLAARVLAKMSNDQDAGLGDTIARLFGNSGAIFKKWYRKLTGSDCGCSDRQVRLNIKYPLKPTNPTDTV